MLLLFKWLKQPSQAPSSWAYYSLVGINQLNFNLTWNFSLDSGLKLNCSVEFNFDVQAPLRDFRALPPLFWEVCSDPRAMSCLCLSFFVVEFLICFLKTRFLSRVLVHLGLERYLFWYALGQLQGISYLDLSWAEWSDCYSKCYTEL